MNQKIIIEIENFLKPNNKIMARKKICVLHLSHKWINELYDENDF